MVREPTTCPIKIPLIVIIDNKEAIATFRRLKEINQVMCYTEIGKLHKFSEYSLYSGTTPEKRLWDWTKQLFGSYSEGEHNVRVDYERFAVMG